jgi:hypothetical protein
LLAYTRVKKIHGLSQCYCLTSAISWGNLAKAISVTKNTDDKTKKGGLFRHHLGY